MEYKIIRDEESFIAEKDTWNAICDSMIDSTPFQTWEWNYIWWKNNEPADSLYVIKAFEGKTVFGYAPLVMKDNTVEFIGGRDMDYGLFVVVHKQMSILQGFINSILANKLNIFFQEMPSRSTQLHMVQKNLDNTKRVLYKKTTRASYIDTSLYASFDDYFKLLSQSMRNKTIKTGLKKGLSIKIEPVTESLFKEIEEIHLNRQEIRGGAGDISWSFEIIRQMNLHGLMDVYIARDGENAVGFLAAMKYKNKSYIWLVAFKMEYRECFPGQLLFYNVIKDGFENGFSGIDFMRGDYDFKMRWECALDTNFSAYVFSHYLPYRKKKTWFAVRPKLRNFLYKHEKLTRLYKKHA